MMLSTIIVIALITVESRLTLPVIWLRFSNLPPPPSTECRFNKYKSGIPLILLIIQHRGPVVTNSLLRNILWFQLKAVHMTWLWLISNGPCYGGGEDKELEPMEEPLEWVVVERNRLIDHCVELPGGCRILEWPSHHITRHHWNVGVSY